MFSYKQQVRPTDLYAVLGVPRDASESSIKKAFHSLSLSAHPDKAGDSAEAHSRYVRILEAHNVLRDPARRRAYDLARWEYKAECLPNSFANLFARAAAAQSSGTAAAAQSWCGSRSSGSRRHHRGNADRRQEASTEPSGPAEPPQFDPSGDDDENSPDDNVFESFGGYEAFEREFEEWKQQQQQQEEPPAAQSAEPRTGTGTGTGAEREARLPPELIHAYLRRQMAPIPEELERLQFVLEAITERLEDTITPLREGGAQNTQQEATRLKLDAALRVARVRVRRLDRHHRANAAFMLRRTRALPRRLYLYLDLGLAHSIDRLVAETAEARGAVTEIDRLACMEIARVAATATTPIVARDLAIHGLVEELAAEVRSWGERVRRGRKEGGDRGEWIGSSRE